MTTKGLVLAIMLLYPSLALALVDTLRPTGVGSSDAWTASAGSKWTTVDEDSPNDGTDYVYTAADATTQDFTNSDLVTVSTPDSAWIKVRWTWTRGSGAPRDLLTYYDIGGGFTAFDHGQTTKGGTYVTDSVKLTSPSSAQMNALQFRSTSNGSSGTEEWRVTWWQAVVYETAAAAGKSQVIRVTITE